MLYIIGLGLGGERDSTLRGLDAAKKCEKVYDEVHTSLLPFGLSTDGLSTLKLYGKLIILANREMVEEKVDNILSEAYGSDVTFLVVGDPFGYSCKGTDIEIFVGRKQYEPPRYMTINTVIEQVLEVEQKRGESAYDEGTDCVGFAWLGSEDQMIVAGTIRQIQTVDFGRPLPCLVMVGKTHPVKEEMLEFYQTGSENSEQIGNGIA